MVKRTETLFDMRVDTQFTMEEMAEKLMDSLLNYDNVVRFIAILDRECQDWGVTEKLINHFDALKEIYAKEIPEDECNLVPENILGDKR